MESLSGITNLAHALEIRATEYPEQLAYTYLESGEREAERVTFGGLQLRALAVASRLQAMGFTVGDRVLLLYPPGIDYLVGFLGCLHAGLIAVPVAPPNPARLDRTVPVVGRILSNSGARCILTTKAIVQFVPAVEALLPQLADVQWVAMDDLEGGEESRREAASFRRPSGLKKDDIALLQYTSGSTGQPKGVILSHANLLANQQAQIDAYRLYRDMVAIDWLPLYHDMGLAVALAAIISGGHIIIMSPADFVRRPLRWLRAITRYRATFSAAPNFAFELCARKVEPRERDELDLRSWKTALCGSEPVRAESLELFAAAFQPAGFERDALTPSYGLAETCVFVSATPAGAQPQTLELDQESLQQLRLAPPRPGRASTILTGNGPPVDASVYIAGADGTPAAPDQVGEIWLRGPSVGQGYWDQEQETQRVFGALTPAGEGPYLRTGDLGFLRGGELYVAGRIKDLIIVRGANHHPQDIEATVAASYPSVRPGGIAAFCVEADGEERLVVVTEVNPRFAFESEAGADEWLEAAGLRSPPEELGEVGPDGRLPFVPESIIGAIRAGITLSHGLTARAIVLIEPKTIPKTTSGKIQRRACRQMFVDRTLKVLAQDVEPADGAS